MKKILILPGSLRMGGAERVAANIAKYAPEGEFEFHYISFFDNNVYDKEIEERGGKVFVWPSPSAGYREYIERLGKLIDEHKYAAIHSHTMYNSGINLEVARKHGVPVRIAHSHTTKTEHKVSFVKKAYESRMQKLILKNCTHLLACGVEAGRWLFGKEAFDRNGRVIYNGIDTDLFRFSEEKREKIRDQYGLGDRFVIGHSGTLIPLKNQEFLIRLMPEILKKKENACLMLMGKDEHDETYRLKQTAEELGVASNVIFTGPVMNPYEYLSAFDVFAFPSLREGTPLALIEAQANGLPCVISECIPGDAQITDLINVIELTDTAAWADRICGAGRQEPEVYAQTVSDRGFDVKKAYMPIYEIYRGNI